MQQYNDLIHCSADMQSSAKQQSVNELLLLTTLSTPAAMQNNEPKEHEKQQKY